MPFPPWLKDENPSLQRQCLTSSDTAHPSGNRTPGRTNSIWTHCRAPQFNKKAVKALALESQKYIHEGHDWDCLWIADTQRACTLCGDSCHRVQWGSIASLELMLFHLLPLQEGPGLFLLTIKISYHQEYLLDICFYSNLRTNLEFFSETTYSQAVLRQ